MFELVVDSSVLERLAPQLELWSAGLPGVDRSHLLSLLGLGAAALAAADAVCALAPPLAPTVDAVDFAMSTPGFADALSPAGDATLRCATAGHSLAIVHGPEPDRWTVTSRDHAPNERDHS